MTTRMRQKRGHTGAIWYNYKSDRHGRHKTGKPVPAKKSARKPKPLKRMGQPR